MKKGLIFYYLNKAVFHGLDDEKILEFAKNTNQTLINECLKDGYALFFITTTNEASRIEKMDFNKPFKKGV